MVNRLYREFRAHQAKVASNGGGVLATFPSGRTERSYASAPYGEHALSAYAAAKSHAAFLRSRGVRPS